MPKKNIRDKDALPKSPTSMAINWIAVIIFIYSLVLIKDSNLSGLEAVVVSMIALAVPIIILEYIFLKPYRRPSTGLNFEIKNEIDISRVTVKIIGLYATIGFVALIYWAFPVYRTDPFYDNYWAFAKYVALIILAGGIPYFIILDKYLVEPRESYWHFGMFILGRWNQVDKRIAGQHILGWLIKLFFLPLMFGYLTGNINVFRSSDFALAKDHFAYMYDYLYNLIFTIDLVFITVGYLMTMKIFDSHIRTAEPTIFGWLVALSCYDPFWGITSGSFLQYDDDYYWGNLFAANESLYSIWGIIILTLLFIYMWASTAFGIRFSNLTNRGILTNGPYRFSMHPAYVSKNLSWWLVSVPFLSQASPSEAIRHSLLLLGLNIIYYLRAVTEERHLSQDPNYVKYGLAMNKRSIFRGLFKILPFLKYNPEKYLRQLDNYSGFIIPGSKPVTPQK